MIQAQQNLQERLSMLWILIAAAGSLLGARLVQLQIIRSVEYEQAAERNRTQMIYQTAPRGRLYDRNGTLVATNQPAFTAIYLPGTGAGRADLRRLADDLAKELRQDPGELLEKLEQAVREKTAIRLAENLPSAAAFRLSEIKTIYPGVDLVLEARRFYPFGAFASHLIGYMGKMDPRSWRELKGKGYRADSRIGRMGLEQVFERELRGRDGGIRMEVDAQGRLKRILERMPWGAGSNIHLTIDAPAQRAADEGLRKSPTGRGAVVALDPASGAILALASHPDFDPNAFLSSDPEAARRVAAEVPEFNNAISGAYQPGSTFKIITGAAGLAENRITTEDSAFCPGYFELGKRIMLCWDHKGHKRISWLAGLAQSCDVYFYTMGLKTGGELIEKYARLFGFGAKTKIALKGEKAGNMFGPAARAARKLGWYDGDTANLAIGQGELLVTPIQNALMMSAVANRGTLWRPHFTSRIEYPHGIPEYRHKPEKLGAIPLRDKVWDELWAALGEVVTAGTGRAAAIPGVEVRGKTGTAQNPLGEDHAWFVAFAKRLGEEPKIAVAVLVENGGHGAGVAGPIARSVIMAYLRLQEKKPGVVVPVAAPVALPSAAEPRMRGSAGLPVERGLRR